VFFASAGISQLEIGTTGLQFSNLNTNITGYTVTQTILGSLLAMIVHNLLIV